MSKSITIALAGNPNSGKTTIFNNLTGSRQHVGNYPGVTVERKEGYLKYRDYEVKVIDLPGTYSLTAYSPDEVVARNVIIYDKPDLIVNVVDASNIERNLYLTAQLKELEIPIILVLNMIDVAEANGLKFDYNLLSNLIGLPIVKTIGTKNQGTESILNSVIQVIEGRLNVGERPIKYNPHIETEITRIQNLLLFCNQDDKGKKLEKLFPLRLARWIAIKLLENDREVRQKISTLPDAAIILKQVNKSRAALIKQSNDDPEMLIVDGRYAFIRGACQEALTYTQMDRITLTEKIDKILLNRVVGLPIFLAIMWMLFQLTFTLGAPPMNWLEAGFSFLGNLAEEFLPDGLIKSLIIDGIISGVGGVVTFLPNIVLLFLGIALLEGTGYMARAAFLMDKIMHKVGLHGKSFVPMLTGFGCNVPAIMATRTLENENDRLVTMLITPLMSCGARLPVYTLLTTAFFPVEMAGNILFSIYLIGIILAIGMAKLFRTFLLPGKSEAFVMELPSYKLPTLKSVLLQMWERAWLYLKKAGTIILAASIVIWALFTFPSVDKMGNEFATPSMQMENSYAGQIGKTVEPVIKPLGLDWRSGIALIAGFSAKEVVVSTLGTLYSMENIDSLEEGDKYHALQSFAEKAREKSGYTPLNAYVLMLFTLIYVPCMATVAVFKKETNSWKWPAFMVGYTTILAWIVCFVVYQGGRWLGIGV